MIGYFFLGVCLLLALLLGGRWFVSADPRFLARVLRYGGVAVLALIALFLLVTGRVGLAMLPGLAALALLRGGVNPRTMRWPGRGSPSGAGPSSRPGERTSEVETAYLRMTLEHATGDMRGDVLRGPHAGRELSDMTLVEVLDLLAECRREDPESAQLLETWLDRTQGPDWRDSERQENGGARRQSGSGSAVMDEQEARDILGVSEAAGPDEIRAAYHRLMMRHHPDKGGSAYLAAKINQARDKLLGA